MTTFKQPGKAMSEITLDIKPWGNNLGVRLPAAVGAAGGAQRSKTSYVLCHPPQSFDWRARGAKPHPKGRLDDDLFAQACAVLNQIVTLNA
jgi:hypothetical protein